MSYRKQVAPAVAFNSYLECTLTQQAYGGGFTLSVLDLASGIVIGRRKLEAGTDGNPPALTVADAIELVGGFYRLGTLQVDLACRALDVTSQHLTGRARRRARAIRLAQLREAAA